MSQTTNLMTACVLLKEKPQHFHMHICYLDILLSQLSTREAEILTDLSLAHVDIRHS